VEYAVGVETLCFAMKKYYISINNLFLFFESRPSKTGGVKEDYYV
jgi:hypothetical protein